MAKHLNEILKQARDRISGKDQFAGSHKSTTEKLSLGKNPGVDYAPKAGDEQEFVAAHEVEKHEYPYGNESLFTGDVVKYSLTTPQNSHMGKDLDKAKADEFAPVKEDVEQINEISKSKLASYISKAAKAAHSSGKRQGFIRGYAQGGTSSSNNSDKPAYEPDEYKEKEDEKRNAQKRLSGIDKATKKLTGNAKVSATEEVEQIDELSKKTVGSYALKAHKQGDKDSFMFGLRNDATAKKYEKSSQKRYIGVQTAINKLAGTARVPAKEETEIVDEALVGKQKNIDVAPPYGKLTGADFKALQKKKKEAKEEVEQVDEKMIWKDKPSHTYDGGPKVKTPKDHTYDGGPKVKTPKDHTYDGGPKWKDKPTTTYITPKPKSKKDYAVMKKEEVENITEKKESEDKKCNMSEAGKWCPMHEYADCKKMSKLTESVPGRAEAAETIADLKKHSSAVVRSHAKKAEKLFDDDPEQSHYHLTQAVNAASSSKKSVKEEVQYIDEVLTKKDPASKWIHDFVHSDNPKFAGKSKKERQRMALGAYYSKMREETEVQEDVEELDEMARKVSDNATKAFLDKKPFKSKNTKSTGDELHLHGNKIAYHKDGKIHATMAGWPTKTTKDRLNSLSSAVGGQRFHTKGGKHYYGDKEIASDDHVVIKEGAIGAVQPLIGGDDAEHHRDELAMAKTELRALANKAMDLVMSMSDEMHVEPWIQSKIAKAKGMISDIHDHLSYGDHKKPDAEQTDTPITLPNMSVDVNTGQNV